MTNIFVDSSAWVEYLNGSTKGEQLKQFIDRHILFTTAISVSEVIAKTLRSGQSSDTALEVLRSLSTIVSVDLSIGLGAAKLYTAFKKTRPKIALADAIVIAAARSRSAKIVTCDTDLQIAPEAIILSD